MKIVSIVGARPQFIKFAPVSRELRKAATEIVVHTGQHYDDSLSEVFFQTFNLPKPDYHLGVGSGTHAQQTGEMLKRIEEVLEAQRPDYVLVYGDTNSTLAGALAAAKVHTPVAHVEAGLRSYNRLMPEEINRIVTDHLSDLLFCPTNTAVKHLRREGITRGVHLVGDVMYDALRDNIAIAERNSTILERLQLKPRQYVLATVHRAENTDDLQNLEEIMKALLAVARSGETVIFPAHPRTQKRLGELGTNWSASGLLLIISPVSYPDMLQLESKARVILTDSGGIQKEAYWLRVPCVTLRKETEWVETVQSGWNLLVGTHTHSILQAAQRAKAGNDIQWPWAEGEASKNVAAIITQSKCVNSSRRGGEHYGAISR
jgi:UDP-GlcNAc3NAcA epimerase